MTEPTYSGFSEFHYEFDAPKYVDFASSEHEKEMDDSWFQINREPETLLIDNQEKRTTRVYIPSTPSTPFVSNVKPVHRIPPLLSSMNEGLSRNLFFSSESKIQNNTPNSHNSLNKTHLESSNNLAPNSDDSMNDTNDNHKSSLAPISRIQEVSNIEKQEKEITEANTELNQIPHFYKRSKTSYSWTVQFSPKNPSHHFTPSNLLTSFDSNLRGLGPSRRVTKNNQENQMTNNLSYQYIDQNSESHLNDLNKNSTHEVEDMAIAEGLVLEEGPHISSPIHQLKRQALNVHNTPIQEKSMNTNTIDHELTAMSPQRSHTSNLLSSNFFDGFKLNDIQFSSPTRIRVQEVKTLTPEKKNPIRTNLVQFKKANKLTQPIPFNFRTENLKHTTHLNSESRSPYKEKNLFDEIPSRFKSIPDPTPQQTFNKKLTIPVSPQLSKSKVRYHHMMERDEPTYDEWVKMKNKFYEAPSRFKNQPDPIKYTSPPKDVTVPVTPNVLKHYSSGPKVLSTEERELQEMKKQFKATPLDRNILNSDGKIGIKFLRSHSPTKPVPFQFSATNTLQEKRNQRLRAKIEENQSVSEEIKLTNNVETKKRKRSAWESKTTSIQKRRRLTIPQSPNITKPKVKIIQEPKEESRDFVARKMPDFSNPNIFIPDSKPIELQPFQLATEKRALLRYSEEDMQTQTRTIYPEPEKSFDPTPTIPEPFNLMSNQLHEYAKSQFEEKLQRENEKQKRIREFKARPLPNYKPFEIDYNVKEIKPLNIVTNSEIRAQSRKDFDERRKQKQLQQLNEIEKSKILEKKRQDREIIKLRRNIDKMLKARPLPKFYRHSNIPSRYFPFEEETEEIEIFNQTNKEHQVQLVYEDLHEDQTIETTPIKSNLAFSNPITPDRENSQVFNTELNFDKKFDLSNRTIEFNQIKPLTPIKQNILSVQNISNEKQTQNLDKLFNQSLNSNNDENMIDVQEVGKKNTVSLTQQDRFLLVRRMNRISFR